MSPVLPACWTSSCRKFGSDLFVPAVPCFEFCIAHVLYRQKKEKVPATLPAVDDLLSDPDKTAHEVWTDMITYLHENGATIPIVAKAARDQLNRPEEEAGSVLSTTLSYLTIYRDPVVANNVSRSDFHIRDLMHSEKPVTLYIVTEPVDKQRLQPLVRVLVNMIVWVRHQSVSHRARHQPAVRSLWTR
jgi:type IV secretion system protein VirD4